MDDEDFEPIDDVMDHEYYVQAARDMAVQARAWRAEYVTTDSPQALYYYRLSVAEVGRLADLARKDLANALNPSVKGWNSVNKFGDIQ